MSWDEEDDKSKRKVDKKFISPEQSYEIESAITSLANRQNMTALEKVSQEDRLRNAILAALEEFDPPYPRDQVLDLAERNLES